MTPERSLWLQEALAEDDPPAPPLSGDVRADICIVGGGFTGLWAALEIRRHDPASRIVLIEADICGGGASGRNGGFMLSWAAKYLTLEKLFGVEAAGSMVRMSEDNISQIETFCRDEGIDAEIRRDGWLWTASNDAQRDAWETTLEGLSRATLEPFVELPDADVARMSGSARHLMGIFSANSATVHPARLARGLRRLAIARGVEVHEATPMRTLDRGRPAKVVTQKGTVTAEKVLLAMNAWSGLLPELGRRMIVVGSDIVVSRPLREFLERTGITNGLAISDSRLFTHYYRTTPSWRMVFGKGGGSFMFGNRMGGLFEGPSRYDALVREKLRWFYPGFPMEALVQSWSGPIDRSMTGLPLFGRLDGAPHISFAFGYSGNGVAPSRLGGLVLASLALDRQNDWSQLPLVDAPAKNFPPEPARYLGAHMVRAALRRREQAEDEGRKPKALDAALSDMMPGGMVPVMKKS